MSMCRCLLGTSLFSSSLVLQQFPAFFVYLTRMVFEMGGNLPYSCNILACCSQNLFKIAPSFLHTFFSVRCECVHIVHPYSKTHTSTSWKKYRFILSDRSDIDMMWIAVHTITWRMLTSLSVDEIFSLKYVNRFTNFRGLPFKVEMAPS